MNAPLRVLHVAPGNLFGGVETSLLALAGQPGQAFAVCFEGRLSGALAARGSKWTRLGPVRASRPWQIWRARRTLARLLARGRFDAVICHMPWTLAMLGPAARQAKTPLVFWMHDVADGQAWTERWARRTPPDLALANSRFTAASLPKLFPHPPPHAVVYPPAPDQTAAPDATERASVRAELAASQEDTVIVQASRMEPYKGHRVHLEALAKLRDVPGWTAWIVGGAQRTKEQTYLADLQRFAEENGLEKRVRFLGERRDVPRLLAAADVFCQPNVRGEPFGLVFIEAMQAGLPVVCTSAGGVLEIMNDSCGRLVPPGDGLALADCLRELILSAPLRARLGANGPARARALCDPSIALHELSAALRRLKNQ